MKSSSEDPYLSIVDLYQRLDTIVRYVVCVTDCRRFFSPISHQANISNPATRSDDECLTLLMSARSTCDAYLAQCESSRQDVIAARERLKLHEARAHHLSSTARAIEDFIGEARSRFHACGIPIHPISIPPHVNHSPTPLDLASQLFSATEVTTTPSDHVQESAGITLAVTGATSERVRVYLDHICVFFLKTFTPRVRINVPCHVVFSQDSTVRTCPRT